MVVRIGGGRCTFFGCWRKYRHFWAFLASELVLVVQERSSIMGTPPWCATMAC